MTRFALLAACLAMALPTAASATITQTFTSRSAFAAAIGPITGHAIDLPGAAPVFAASLVSGPITLSARDDQLAGNGASIVSTAFDSDVLILDFAQPVFGVGLFGGIGDADFNFFDGETDVEAVGSGSDFFPNDGVAHYFGLFSDTAFSQLRLSVRGFDAGASTIAFVGLQDRIDLAGAVPEPATWAMMLFGFGAIGLADRRRRAPMPVQLVR